MGLFTSLIGNTSKTFARKHKWGLFILAIIFLLLVAINYFIEKYTGEIVGPLIKELVIKKSHGMYRAEFSKMGIVLNSGVFYVDDFNLSVDSATFNANQAGPKPGNVFVRTNVPRLYIRVSNLLSVYLRRQLRIIGIVSDHPHINILKLRGDTTIVKKKEIKLDDPYKLISDYLTVFEINDFTIKEGSFKLSAPYAADYENYEIKNISIRIMNFLLDKNAAENKDKFFYTDNVEMEIRDQTLYLPDSLHKMTFDRLFISTITKNLELDNFKLEERPRTARNDVIKTNLNRMYFVIPKLRLTGIDFIKAYNRQAFDVGKISVDQPIIKFVSSGEKKKDDAGDKGTGILHGVIRYLRIDTLLINDGAIDLTLKKDESSSHFSVEKVSLKIDKMVIDSIGNQDRLSNIAYKDIELELDNGKLSFPGHLKKIDFASVKADSNPVNIKINGLDFRSLRPEKGNRYVTALEEQRNIGLKLFLPEIRINGLDLPALINRDTLKLSGIWADNPEIHVCSQKENQKEKSKPVDLKKLADPFLLIKKSLRAAYIDDIFLNKGSVHIGYCKKKSSDQLNITDFIVHGSRIKLDSETTRKNTVLGAENWRFECGSLNYKLPGQDKKIFATGVEFNGNPGLFIVSELNLYSKPGTNGKNQKASEREAQINNIRLNGINVQNFLQTGELSLDTFSIASLNIDLAVGEPGNKKQAKKTDFRGDSSVLKKIMLNKFFILSGHAKIKQEGETLFYADSIFLGLDKIAYAPGPDGIKNLNMDKMDIDLDRYSFHLKKIGHRLTGDRISLHSNKKTALLTNLKLTPLSAGTAMNIYKVDIPAIKFNGFELAKILFDSTFICSDIVISQPVIDLTLVQKQSQKNNPAGKSAQKKPLPHPLKFIRAGKIRLVNGNVKVKRNRNDTSQLIEIQNVNLTLNDLDIDSAGIISGNKLLYSRDIDLMADYITFYQPEKKQFMNLNHVNFSTQNRLLEGSGFYFSNNTGKTTGERNKFKLDLGSLRITDLDLLSILNGHYINLGEITLTQPRVVFEKMKKEKGSAGKKQPMEFVYPFDSSALRFIRINSLNLVNGKVDLITKDPGDTLSPVNKLYIRGVDLSVEKLRLIPQKHYTLSTSSFLSSFNLNIDKVRYDLPDKLNRIEIGRITLNSSDTTLIVSDFKLMSKVGKYEYGPAKGFQSDWIHLTNKKLTVRNIHLNKLLFSRQLITPAVNVDSLKVFVFRDKRVPFVEVYKPLPAAQLRKLKTLIKIDSVIISNGNVVYQEFGEYSKSPGEIYITDMNGKLLNITNDSATLAKQPRLYLGANAAFAGKGLINMQVVFDLPDTNDVFQMGLILADIELSELNRMLAPTAFVKVKSGYDKNLIMTAKANNDYAYGEMRFYYNDLKITVLNKKTETPKGIGNALMSFFANSFFINSNNPKLFKLRKGEVFFERNKYKSIFNYWVKTFLSGVVTSIGAKSNKKQIEKIQDAQLKKYETITSPD